MTTPSLFDVPVPRRHRRVRDTSIQQYAVARERLKGRQADVLRWLAAWWNAKQTSPTSAELAQAMVRPDPVQAFTDVLLFTRRGLSDLQTHGLVETVEKRVCAVTGRMCHTWRVAQR